MAGRLFVLAAGYRIVYAALGGYIAARLAPREPVRHALILGLVGVAGVRVAIAQPELGPLWYPIALAVTGLPFVWLGGALYRPRV